jgi:hypothetical protein
MDSKSELNQASVLISTLEKVATFHLTFGIVLNSLSSLQEYRGHGMRRLAFVTFPKCNTKQAAYQRGVVK